MENHDSDLMRILVGYLIYHLVITNIANWKMAHRKFVSFPITKMVDLSSSFLVNVSKKVKPLRPIFLPGPEDSTLW